MAVSCYRPVGRAEWIPPWSGYQPDLQALLVAQDEAQLSREMPVAMPNAI